MQTLRLASLIWGAAAAAALAGAATAQTDATTLLTGFGDFSGDEIQLTFDDRGFVNGDDVASVDGVGFELTAGGPAKYYEDPFPRESGPAGLGSANNFWGFTSPYPDLDVFFPGPVHRVAFEMRANDADDVSVTLLSNGELVDEVVMPSRGSDALYFYGYENPLGFDEMRVDAVANASGAFSLDNLTFETLVVEEPPPDESGDLPVFACDGFASFPRHHGRHGHHKAPFRALVAKLTDAEGNVVGAEDLATPPAVRVLYSADGSEETLDVTDDVVWAPANHFMPTRHGSWLVWLLNWRMRAPGVYMTTMESGDPSMYTIDPVCADWMQKDEPSHDWRRHGWHR